MGRKAGGRPAKPEAERAKAREVWINDIDWATIGDRAQSVGIQRGPYMVRATLGRHLMAVPVAENLPAWQKLAGLASNLNQLTRHLNEQRATGKPVNVEMASELSEIKSAVAALRAEIMGVDPS